ncbi:MAG: MlaD family protein [Vulcanimicrobiaceae bacterium]
MTKQAQVGLLAILSLLLLFGMFYVITDFAARNNGYKVGVRFKSAAGLHTGSLVYFSGLTVGTVDSITLLPDNTVDVIIAVNPEINGKPFDIPRDSKFLIQAPLTGDPNLLIVPPVAEVNPIMLERRVLPPADQPQGLNTATIADLLQQGQGEVKRLDTILAEIQTREPRLLDSVEKTTQEVNQLTTTANASVSLLSAQALEAGRNIVALSQTLEEASRSSGPKVGRLLDSLDASSASLAVSAQSIQKMATDPSLHTNLAQTAQNIADTTQTISEIAKDLRTISGNAQTQGQVRDTVANLDAATQRLNAILAGFGGRSHVAGVDTTGVGQPVGLPPAKPRTPGTPMNLFRLNVRAEMLSPQRTCCGSPLLTRDRGPQMDLSATLLPENSTSLLLGVNDLGGQSTVNAAILRRYGTSLRYGGGVLYSRLGVLASYAKRGSGLDAYLYDPRYPTLDAYAKFKIAPALRLFFGERSLTRKSRRIVYGIETGF